MPRGLQILAGALGRVAGRQQRRGTGERQQRHYEGELPSHACIPSFVRPMKRPPFRSDACSAGQGSVNNVGREGL